jgi:outer membrane protein OmpA-like peptidoglycan-associated protein
MTATARRICTTALICVGLVLTVGSCATKTQTGVVIGAAGGAAVGGLVGHAAGSTAAGVIIGAAVGGVAGGIIGAEMDKQAKELKQNIPGATVERVGEGIAVTFASGLLYDFDSDVIRPEAASNLRALAASLHKYPGSDLLIVGHTDQVGSAAYNQGLSERRASAAANYLVAQGVNHARVGTRGMGETDPVAANDTELGRQRNRRVEVAIYASEAYRAEVAKRQSQ